MIERTIPHPGRCRDPLADPTRPASHPDWQKPRPPAGYSTRVLNAAGQLVGFRFSATDPAREYFEGNCQTCRHWFAGTTRMPTRPGWDLVEWTEPGEARQELR